MLVLLTILLLRLFYLYTFGNPPNYHSGTTSMLMFIFLFIQMVVLLGLIILKGMGRQSIAKMHMELAHDPCEVL